MIPHLQSKWVQAYRSARKCEGAKRCRHSQPVTLNFGKGLLIRKEKRLRRP
jgi:hypothetical protein